MSAPIAIQTAPIQDFIVPFQEWREYVDAHLGSLPSTGTGDVLSSGTRTVGALTKWVAGIAAVKATGNFTIGTNPIDGDIINVNGAAFTYKTAPSGSYEILIDSTAALTASATRTKLNASVDPLVSSATYGGATNVVTISYDTAGTVGNSFILSSSTGSITVSGGTLSGGLDTVPPPLAAAIANTDYLSPAMTTLGDISYGGSSGINTRLAGNTTSTPKFLKSLGSAGVATAPSWSQPASVDLSDSANLPLLNGSPNIFSGTNQFGSIGVLGTAANAFNGITVSQTGLTGGRNGMDILVSGTDVDIPGTLNYVGGKFEGRNSTSTNIGDHSFVQGLKAYAGMTGTGRIDSATAVDLLVYKTSTGIIQAAYGVNLQTQNVGNGVIGNVWGVNVDIIAAGTSSYSTAAYLYQGSYRHFGSGTGSPLVVGLNLVNWSKATSTVTTSYGIYMDSSIALGSTTAWAIKVDATCPSQLAGDLTVSGLLKIGSTPVTHTDSAGKILSAALNTVAVGQGGIGTTTLAINGVLYGNTTSAIQALTVNSSATNKFLTQSSSNAPAWATILLGDLPAGVVTGTGTDNHLVRWDGTGAVQDSNIVVADTTGALTNSSSLAGGNLLAITNTSTTASSTAGYFAATGATGTTFGLVGYSGSSDNAAYGGYFSRGSSSNVALCTVGLDIQEISSPSAPPTNFTRIYAKSSDSKLYYQTDGALEIGPIGVGTLGAVVFGGISGVYTQDSTNLFWDDTNNRLGIGTNVPSQPLDVAGNILVSASTANLYLKDISTGWQSASTTVVTPQANNSIRSTSFTSGLVGWSINAGGNAEFQNVDVRGAIHAGLFVYNAIQATAGTLGVFKSAAKLKSDVTVTASPTYGTTTFTVDAVDQDGLSHSASQLFTVGDILRLKDGLIGDTWFTVSAISDQTTFWRYTAKIQAGSNNITYRAGMAIVDYGQTGNGFIIQTADQSNSPYLQMATHLATFSSSDASGTLNVTPQLRLGNLSGSYGYTSAAQIETATVIGTITGNGNASVIVTAAGMSSSPKTASVPVLNGDSASTVGGKIRTFLTSDLDIGTFFNVSGSGANVVLTSKAVAANDATLNISIANGTCTGLTSAPTSTNSTAGVVDTYGLGIGQYGSASKTWLTIDQTSGFRIGNNTTQLAQWDTSGNILIGQSSTASQSSILISSGAIQLRNGGSNTVRAQVAADGSAFFGSGNLSISAAGVLTIGSWTVNSTTISSPNLILDSTGVIKATATAILTTNGIYLDASTTTPTARIGTVSAGALAKGLYWDGSNLQIIGTNFSLNSSGNITATGGTIGGWTLTSSRIASTHVFIDNTGEYISFGATPPTAFGANVGSWLGYDTGTGNDAAGNATSANKGKISIYADASNYFQWIGTKLLIKGANFTLDGSGNLTASSATVSGAITATSGAIGGWSVASTTISSTGVTMTSGATASLALGATPPVSATSGTGTYIDATGLFGLKTSKQTLAFTATDGVVRIGSDVSAAATTAMIIAGTAYTTVAETLAIGDVLIGDNSASKANVHWKKSAGQLEFRGGTTVQAYIDTDGSIKAGAGAVILNANGLRLNQGTSGTNAVTWYDSSTPIGTLSAFTTSPTQEVLLTVRSLDSSTTTSVVNINATNSSATTQADLFIYSDSINSKASAWFNGTNFQGLIIGDSNPHANAMLDVRVTNSATAVFTDGGILTHNSSGTPAANFGSSILFNLKSSTTNSQNAARIGSIWTTATHASRTSAFVIQTVNNAGSLTEVARFAGNGDTTFTGILTVGSGATIHTDSAGKILSTALNTVNPVQGGTGISSIGQGDLIFGSASNVYSVLGKVATASRYLSNSGTSNNPAWAQVDLTNGVTGILPVGNGGTGLSSTTTSQILYSSGTNTIAGLVTANNAVLVTSSGGVPSLAATGASLSVTSSVLNTVQDIRTSASPTFAGITLTSIMIANASGLQIGRNSGTLSNGDNNEVALSNNASYMTFTGPSAAYAVTGFANQVDGRILYVNFNIAQALTLKHDNAGSAAGKRLTIPGQVDKTFSGNIVRCMFIYDQSVGAGTGYWVLFSAIESGNF